MDCELWGPAAQIIADRAKKGTTILVRGPIEQDNYETKDGSKRTHLKLRVEFFQFGAGVIEREREREMAPASADNEEGNFDASPF